MQNKDKKIIITLSVVLAVIIAIIIGVALGTRDSGSSDLDPEDQGNTTSTEELSQEEESEAENGSVASENTSGEIDGVWISNDIQGYVLELSSDGALREYQNRQLIHSGSWRLEGGGSTVVLSIAGSNYPHAILDLSGSRLELKSNTEANSISFKRL